MLRVSHVRVVHPGWSDLGRSWRRGGGEIAEEGGREEEHEWVTGKDRVGGSGKGLDGCWEEEVGEIG